MVNQYFKETLNKLATSIDLTNPNGLEMSAAFEKYVEKVIKPIYPKGANIRQTSQVNDAAGVRTVDWSFRDTNNKIEQAVQASVDNFIQSWASQRGMLDESGQLKPGIPPLPMQVGGISPQVFNGTKTRILNPRTAASVRAAAVRAGGDFITDKNTGMSTWSVPDSALTLDGKQLSRSLRAEVREGDKRWLLGKVALSSSAEGASPANAEERSIATNNRNYRLMLAKYKAMTPEQERQETFLRLSRAGRRFANAQDYERLNPDDPRVMAKRYAQQRRSISRATTKMKSVGKRAIHMARNAVMMALGTILSAIGAALSILGKINATVTEIGTNVRRQAMEDMRYNFEEGFTRQWERFAEKRGFNKEVLNQAAGGIASAWSTPLNYASSNFDALAPYLRDSTRLLVRQSTASGDKNVLHIMSSVIDDLVNKSLTGLAGSKQYTGQSRMTGAFTENMSALQGHNTAWAQLMQYYWYDLTAVDGKFKAAAAAAGKEPNFENWMQQGTWNPDFAEQGNGVTNTVVKTAAEMTYDAVNSLKSSLNSLKTDVLERIAGSLAQVAEDVRSKISNLIARYFPAFAMKEKDRAIYLNTQALAAAENNLPGYKSAAEAGLRATGFTGGLDAFKEIYEGIIKRDSTVLARLPATVNLDALDMFIRYQAPAYYETDRVIRDLNTENTKMEERDNYIPRVIVYDSASNATHFSSLGMAGGYGLQHIQVNAVPPNIRSGSTDILSRIWNGDSAVDPDTPIIGIMNFLGLNMISDWLTGDQIGQRQSRQTEAERQQIALAHRIQGSYSRYKALERSVEGYKNVADNGVLLLSPTGQMLSEIQADVVTSNFHNAERELYDYLAAMYDTGNPQFVLNAYDMLAAFYYNYGHLARFTESNKAVEIRAKINRNTEGVLLGDWVNDISTVFTPSEVLSILRDKRAEYLRLRELEGSLTDYQSEQSLPLQAYKQTLTNNGAIPYDLVEKVNSALLTNPSLPNSLYEVLRMPGIQGVTFDVDEDAIANHTQVITNVYLELVGRTPIKLVSAMSTGLPSDVRVAPNQDAIQALLEAFSATQ